jgi:hypothetical protein
VIRIKPYGDNLEFSDLESYTGDVDPQCIQDSLYAELPDFTAQITSDLLDEFIGAVPGRWDPRALKVILSRDLMHMWSFSWTITFGSLISYKLYGMDNQYDDCEPCQRSVGTCKILHRCAQQGFR